MAKKFNSASLALIEQLKLQIGNISSAIETKGKTLFGSSNIMSNDEITDFSIEFLELMLGLLNSDDPLGPAVCRIFIPSRAPSPGKAPSPRGLRLGRKLD